MNDKDFNLLKNSNILGGGKTTKCLFCGKSIFLLIIIGLNFLFIGCTKTSFLAVDTIDSVEHIRDSLSVNIYLENSKSINGYINNEEKSLMNDLRFLCTHIGKKNIKTHLNYINSKIIPQSNIRDFFDINAFEKAGGNRNISNIISCFDSILKNKPNSINVLVSDFVVTGTSDECIQAKYNLTDALINVIKKDSTFSMIVMQMIGKFDGKCYWGSGKNTEIQHGKRPYYICIMGPCNQIAEIFDVDKLKEISNHIFSFSKGSIPVEYKIGNNNTEKLEIHKSQIPVIRKQGREMRQIKLQTKIGNTLLEDSSFLLDKNNYTIFPKGYEIELIKKQPNSQNYLLTILTNKKISKIGGFEIRIKKRIKKQNYIDKLNTNAVEYSERDNLKTYNVKYILSGIEEAFANDDEFLTRMKITRINKVRHDKSKK